MYAWTGRKRINIKLALYITLWRLANQVTFRDIADRFNVGQGTAFSVIAKVTKILSNKINQFVKWPNSHNKFQKIMEDFQVLRQSHPFPNVVGCLDSTHIEILTPKVDAKSYYNRKGTHSLILQVRLSLCSYFMTTFN